ncbi:MAG TPA: homoserine kinase [Gemmatimonadales bacterium]|nr:homoserine kinase [Gemmatimonadales bacterium]
MRAAAAVTAFAPGGVGNVGPGLDILGLAVEGAGDAVRAEWSDEPGIQVRDPGHPGLSRDPARHTAALAARAVLAAAEEAPASARGIALTVRKGLPLSGGQGGSAASAVAGAVAVNALLGGPLDRMALLNACLVAEETVAGRHLDNIAPSLMGGIVLIRCMQPTDVVSLPVPDELMVVLVRPEQQLRTIDARAVLPAALPRDLALYQAAQVGALVAALAIGDYALLGRAIDDRVAEPARAGLLPGFPEAKAAALAAGALGSSISGSGPTAFALTRGRASGERVAAAMVAAYADAGQRSTARVAPVDRVGARLIDSQGESES